MSRVLNLTWISSQPPSAADLYVVDLRATRVELDHRSSACGRAQDLVGAPLLDLRRRRGLDGAVARRLVGASERKEAPLGHSTVAHSPNGERAHQRGAQGGASGTLSPEPLVDRSESLAAARERERRREMRLGFARGRRSRFCSTGNLAQPSD
jgi:hypothetical protein